jgi:hypothetical protein
VAWIQFTLLFKITNFSGIHLTDSIKNGVSETEICLRLQTKPTLLGPIDRTSPYLQKVLAEDRHIPVSEMFLIRLGRWLMSKNFILIIHHRHRPFDLFFSFFYGVEFSYLLWGMCSRMCNHFRVRLTAVGRGLELSQPLARWKKAAGSDRGRKAEQTRSLSYWPWCVFIEDKPISALLITVLCIEPEILPLLSC